MEPMALVWVPWVVWAVVQVYKEVILTRPCTPLLLHGMALILLPRPHWRNDTGWLLLPLLLPMEEVALEVLEVWVGTMQEVVGLIPT